MTPTDPSRRVAVYAGSFDPFHLGHLDIVERAASQFDEVIVAAVGNPAKRPFLSLAERVAVIAASTTHLPNVRSTWHDGLTADLAQRERADVLIRVSGKELRHERVMAAANQWLGMKTVFFSRSAALAPLSSTVVRELVRTGHLDHVANLVPPAVFEHLVANSKRPELS